MKRDIEIYGLLLVILASVMTFTTAINYFGNSKFNDELLVVWPCVFVLGVLIYRSESSKFLWFILPILFVPALIGSIAVGQSLCKGGCIPSDYTRGAIPKIFLVFNVLALRANLLISRRKRTGNTLPIYNWKKYRLIRGGFLVFMLFNVIQH